MKARLLVLGMLHRGDLHPYEIKRRLQAAMVECYLDLGVGTLYYAIRQLEKDGLISAIAEERVTRGGVRTVYQITPAGLSEFQEGFYRQFEDDGPVSQTLYGVVLFLHCVDHNRLVEVIRYRIARLNELITKLAPIKEIMAPTLSIGGTHLFLHIEQQRRLDRDWLKGLLDELESSGPSHTNPKHVD
jgi:DNA-binding PadR family transcriptional regulator